LWLPILAHILGDIIQGRTAFDYNRVRPESVAPPAGALEA
jgi:hypothetical protein